MDSKKKTGTGKAQPTQHNGNNALEVMKPFLNFGLKATAVIASALVTIVRNIPKPETDKSKSKNDRRVIKI